MSFGEHFIVDTNVTCQTASGNAVAASRYLVFALVTERHNVECLVDGVAIAPPGVWPRAIGGGEVDEVPDFYVNIPNDGMTHTVQLMDRGIYGTPFARTITVTLASACTGVLMARVLSKTLNTQTRETYVDVEIYRGDTSSTPWTCRLLVDGRPAGAEITLGPSEPSTTKRITLPPDGSEHLIKAELKAGGTRWSEVPFLWYVVQAANPGGGGGNPPTQPATQFVPGETVFIQSNNINTPLATDGSEWVLVEIAPTGTTDQWKPAGVEGGLISPDDEGAWWVSIPTDAQDFPSGSQWTVRSRRFRNYQESQAALHYFEMVIGPVPPVPGHNPPVCGGPVNHNQPGSSWMDIWGSAIPGAIVSFTTQVVTRWGTISVPLAVSTGPNGQWQTRVYDRQQDPDHSFKVVSYRARSTINGQSSDWSAPLEVTWQSPIR